MNSTAQKLAEKAQGLTAKINACFASREIHTAKKLAQARHQELEGARLKRTQQALYKLASMHQYGNVPDFAKNLTSVKAIYDLVGMKTTPIANGYHSYHVETDTPALNTKESAFIFSLLNPKSEAEKLQEKIKLKIDEIKKSCIEGFYPTPLAVIDDMLTMPGALITDCYSVLEPSAGIGNIVDEIAKRYPLAKITAVEQNTEMAQVLLWKKNSVVYNVDFLEISFSEKFDFVFMNPPFERQQDIQHVMHAFNQLKIYGYLFAIMSPSFLTSSTVKAQRFRDFLADHDLVDVDLRQMAENSFKESGTSVSTVMLKLKKLSD